MKTQMKLMSKYLLVLLTFLPIDAHTHPHSWISLKTEFVLDEKGQLAELLQHWEFDVYYSTIKLADIESNFDNKQQGLRRTAQEMAENLENYNYFSELKVDDQSITLAKPSAYSLTTVFNEGQQQLLLTMRFRWNDLPMIKRKVLSWRVFDPTYYIAMKHQASSQIVIQNIQGDECSTNIISPQPSAEMIEYATNLDSSQKNTNGLGHYFAEKVLIRCD